MALTTTPGSASADSYVSVADADTYLTRLADGNWAAKSTPNKEALLKQATQELDRWFAQHATDACVMNQALSWPWVGEEIQLVADSGSTTTFVDDTLQTEEYPDDYFNGGALFVYDTSDDAAPEFELQAISDFVRSTGTITTGAFTAAIGSGDECWIFPPVPTWLKRATCEQAVFLNEDEQSRTGNDIRAGIRSRSDGNTSVTFKENVQAQWLCDAAFNLVAPWLPREPGIARA